MIISGNHRHIVYKSKTISRRLGNGFRRVATNSDTYVNPLVFGAAKTLICGLNHQPRR